MIAINDTLFSELGIAEPDLAMLWCRVKTKCSYVLIGVCYRPPGTPSQFPDLFNESVLSVTDRYSDCEVGLAGGFNFPGIDWINYSTIPECRDVTQCNTFINNVQSFGLSQIVASPTHGNVILNLIFTSRSESIRACHVLEEISDHKHVFIEADVSPLKRQRAKKTFTNYHRAKIPKLMSLLDDFS